MQMKRRAVCALAIAAAMALSACGFQLRGSNGRDDLPFKTVYINVGENSLLGVQLKRNIRALGNTEVVKDAKDAQGIVDILSENRSQSILALNTQGRIREYTLYYRLRFRVRDNQNHDLMPPTEIVIKRQLSFNETQALADEKQQEIMYRDMQNDAVQQMLRRIAATKPAAHQ
jgi:LPS-assembly lipoprotein